MKMKIQVSQNDIFLGRPGSESECPIALAIKRVRPDAHVGVTGDKIEFDYISYFTCDEIMHFVNDYDVHIPVEPFEFEMDEDELVCNPLTKTNP